MAKPVAPTVARTSMVRSAAQATGAAKQRKDLVHRLARPPLGAQDQASLRANQPARSRMRFANVNTPPGPAKPLG